MHPRLAAVLNGVSLTGDLARDTDALFAQAGSRITREHVPRVARLAQELAGRFGLDPDQAVTAAYLHDVGGAFPRSEMVAACTDLGLIVLPEERQVPMLLHQKLSAELAREAFGVTDAAVLDAVRCHTTLRAHATPLDELLFLADKIEWDRGGEPPYKANLLSTMDGGLTAGARWLLAYLHDHPEDLLVVHPWLREAWAWYGVTWVCTLGACGTNAT